MTRSRAALSLLIAALMLAPAIAPASSALHRACVVTSEAACHQTARVFTCSCCTVGDLGNQPGLAQDRTEIAADQQAPVATLAACIDACQQATPPTQFDASPPHRSSIALFVYLSDLRL